MHVHREENLRRKTGKASALLLYKILQEKGGKIGEI